MISAFFPEAIAELEEAFQYYESRAGLGEAFKAEVRATLELIIEHPLAWRRLRGGLRQCRLKRSPYVLVYGWTTTTSL